MIMKPIPQFVFGLTLFVVMVAHADEVVFQDDFKGKLEESWSWVREDRKGWRVTEHGLEVRVQPGNMWGAGNNAKNLLVRTAPAPSKGELEISVSITNQPTTQYEQVDLVWYYDDSHMVKIGLERVHGQNSLVMGREEADKTTTLAIIPVTSTTLDVRLTLRGSTLHGEFREAPAQEWRPAGKCEAPVKGAAKASIQAYQGAPDVEHWARVTGFRVETGK